MTEVIAVGVEDLQVGGVVVCRVSVSVVNHFLPSQKAAEHLLHHETMLSHVAGLR